MEHPCPFWNNPGQRRLLDPPVSGFVFRMDQFDHQVDTNIIVFPECRQMSWSSYLRSNGALVSMCFIPRFELLQCPPPTNSLKREWPPTVRSRKSVYNISASPYMLQPSTGGVQITITEPLRCYLKFNFSTVRSTLLPRTCSPSHSRSDH